MDLKKEPSNEIDALYEDFSHVSDDSAETWGEGVHDSFPVKLHYMLEQFEKDDESDIIGWQPHGRCFLVRNQKLFVENVLPKWFRQTKLPSFNRQLNIYGFRRLTAGPDRGCYYHQLFLRGKRFLARHIPRTRVKGKGSRKPGCPETEPCFALMPSLPHSNAQHILSSATEDAVLKARNDSLADLTLMNICKPKAFPIDMSARSSFQSLQGEQIGRRALPLQVQSMCIEQNFNIDKPMAPFPELSLRSALLSKSRNEYVSQLDDRTPLLVDSRVRLTQDELKSQRLVRLLNGIGTPVSTSEVLQPSNLMGQMLPGVDSGSVLNMKYLIDLAKNATSPDSGGVRMF